MELKAGCYHVDKETSLDTMCDRASMAAGTIKGKYGKHLCVYEDSLRQKLLQEQNILNNMQDGAGQPRVCGLLPAQVFHGTRTTVGAEALVRWERPRSGPDSSGCFYSAF
jgi:hypothetical protein